MEQMTLFDYEPIQEADINITPLEDVAQMIGCAIGIDFKRVGSDYIAKTKTLDFRIRYGTFAFGDHERFIGCGYNYHKGREIGGSSGPFQSVGKAIEFFKDGKRKWL